VQALLWIARSGAPWRDLPEPYGKSCRQLSCT
jgi:transposase